MKTFKNMRLVLWALLGRLLLLERSLSMSMGPRSTSHVQRNIEIMNQLRSQMGEIIVDASPMSKGERLDFHIPDEHGSHYYCRKQSSTKETKKAIDSVLRSFQGKCLTKNTGWWTYEWCHQKSIRQLHVKDSKTQSHLMGNYTWSYGEAAEIEEARSNADYSSGIVHVFEHGDECENSGNYRRSEVEFSCCRSRNAQMVGVDALLASVHEKTHCNYAVKVCLRELCNLSDRSKLLSVPEILDKLNCYRNQDNSWWTFEYCPSTKIFQYHQAVNQEQYPKVEEEEKIVLGRLIEIEPHEVEYKAVVNGLQSHLEILYEDGSECTDISPQLKRSTIVQLFCGQTEGINAVIEESMCNYRIHFTSPWVCQYVGLQEHFQVDDQPMTISCTDMSET